MHLKFLLTTVCASLITFALAEEVEIVSPDKSTAFRIKVDQLITHSVYYKGKAVIVDAPFSLEFAQSVSYEKDFIITEKVIESVDETWDPVVGKHSKILNNYNQLKLLLKEKNYPGRRLEMIYRAYNDAVAFRYQFPENGVKPQLKLKHEYTRFRFEKDHKIWMADYNTFTSSQEKEFKESHLSDIKSESIVGMPLLVKVDDVYAAITEANLVNWAGMYLTKGKEENTLVTTLSPLPNSSGEDAHKPLLSFVEEFPAPSPWRVIMLNDQPARLLESEILMNLSEANKIGDTAWIKPGKIAWDGWWTGKPMSKDLLIEYIDFAADMGIRYQQVDAGWYGSREDPDVRVKNSVADLDALLIYAKEKNVRLWLWTHWTHINKHYEEAFALYEKWGVAGVKIDYMDRDDVEMVKWYHKIASKAAEHKLLVNFHGAYKPTGVRRTYPNMITREGVMGNEYNKWSDRMTPDHAVTIAYTRNLLGEMDFTPGGFLQLPFGEFKSLVSPTKVMGTRAHALSMYVIYDSPLMFLCDHPSSYYNQPGLQFLKTVPTVWDDIKALNGEVGKYITVAKNSGNDWFIGSMTNSEAREVEIKLDFIESGNYQMLVFQDTEDGDTYPQKIDIKKITVKKGDTYQIKMTRGGGFVAHLKRINK